MKTINKIVSAGFLAITLLAPMKIVAFDWCLSASSCKNIFAMCTKCFEKCLWKPYCPQAALLTCEYLKKGDTNNDVAQQTKELQTMLKNVASGSPTLEKAVTVIDDFVRVSMGSNVIFETLSCLCCKLSGCPVKKGRNDAIKSFKSVLYHPDYNAIEQSLWNANKVELALTTIAGLPQNSADALSALAKKNKHVSLTPQLRETCIKAANQLGKVSDELMKLNKKIKE